MFVMRNGEGLVRLKSVRRAVRQHDCMKQISLSFRSIKTNFPRFDLSPLDLLVQKRKSNQK